MAENNMKEFIEGLGPKRVRLVPGSAYPSHMKVEVFDFPKGEEVRDEAGEKIVRRRCEIDVEYGDKDIVPLIREGRDEEAILQHYLDWMNDVVKVLISSEWEAESGLSEVVEVLKAKIAEKAAQ